MSRYYIDRVEDSIERTRAIGGGFLEYATWDGDMVARMHREPVTAL